MSNAGMEHIIPGFVSGGGEMGQRIREYNWAQTPLGPLDTWPQSLRTCVRIMLTSRQPIWIGWGPQLIKLYNDPYIAITGGKHPWALGKPASEVWSDIWWNIAPMLQQVMEKNEGTYVESHLLIMERNGYPEEVYYTFSYTPVPGDSGNTEGMICTNTDDTDRIITERQLKTLTELSKNLIDAQSEYEVIQNTISTLGANTHDFPFVCFYTLKEDKGVLFTSGTQNSADHKMPGTIHLADHSDLSALLNMAIETKKPQVLEELQNKIGSLPSGAWAIPPDKAIILPVAQTNSSGPYGFLFIGLNPYRLLDAKYSNFFSLVSERIATSFGNVNALQEERKRIEALAELDRAKTLFFSNISHEFRTPLSLLLGPIDDVLNDPATSEDNKERMKVSYRNALRMQKLVNTLLEFSKIEAGKLEGKFMSVDIAALTAGLASIFRSAIEKAGMELKVICGEIKDKVYVDVDMWEKIILNLVSNAFKYSKEGTITIDIKQTGQQVQVSVSDTGIGISDDQAEKIFERFHRVENNEGRSQEGTGIGLAMVKELVKIHKGKITVKSRHGMGSTFTITIHVGAAHLPSDRIFEYKDLPDSRTSAAFVEEAMKWLPAEQREENDLEAARQLQQAGSKKHTVILADDNADMRSYVHRLLSCQFVVITAVDGEDAFAKIQLHKPDLILSDIMMPRLDGYGLLKKVRGNPITRNIPVIFLSAKAGEEAKIEGIDAGADDYLVKPFSAKELLARVESNIKIAKSRIANETNLRNIIMQAPTAMALFRGPDFVIELVNQKVLDIWDRKYEDVINKPLFEVMPSLAGQGFEAILKNVFDTGIAYHGNEVPLTISHAGKMETTYRNINYTLLQSDHDDMKGIISVGIDVTNQVLARKKIEEEVVARTLELRNLNNALRQSNEDLQQFAHVASHDLKEPVRKIKTFGTRLQLEYGHLLPEQGKLFLTKVHHATDRAVSMIEGVLRYSTLNNGDYSTERVNLNDIINSIKADLELVIQQKNATIKTNNLHELEGNAVLIYQLFYNLINNSLKFSRPGEDPVIIINSSLISEQGDAVLKITIEDNGIGFDPTYADKIFDTFTRLNSKDRYEGTGLGLALCKKIVERHNGRIEAFGNPGKGAIFTIFLPVNNKNNIAN